METRAGYMIVGLFVLLSIFGILSFFLWLAKTDFDYKTNLYTIYFQGSVTGLTLGGTVNYLGVPVGNVKKIELDPKNLEQVNITVAIKDSIPVREDAYASLELQGLTGYKFVQITGGSADSPLLKAKPGQPYPVIPSRYSGVEEIMTTLPRMVNKFTNLVDRINATFSEENRNRFSSILKNTDTLSKELAKSSAPLNSLINNLEKLSFSAENTLTKIDSAADNLASYLQNNRKALDTLTQAGSYEFLKTLGETREMVTSAKHFFDNLDENPRSLLIDTQRKGIYVPQQ
jgi:phospholipid/cholesterol/gamma-HCH transport system substrate-binding protein